MPGQMAINGFLGDSNQAKPHFILVPLLAQGHIIPMVDLARLLAGAGCLVTFITTPVNSARIRPTIDRIERSGLPIHFAELCFPSAEAGLPAGCENLDLIPSPDLFKPFIDALRFLGPQLELYLATSSAVPPTCIIFDAQNSWASEVAKSLGIRQLIFYGPSCIFTLCTILLEKKRVMETISGDIELFLIPGLSEVELMKAHVINLMDRPGWEKIKAEFQAAEESAHGVLMNTFEELEFSCLEAHRKETGKKLLHEVLFKQG